ncbi:TRAP transporter small permease [Microbacterium sp. JZ31]|uniref:TRAP transporter small permease n=1 Tax=Microbacterium sp. JZ31 TaxID=1906274 RepID=UPI0019348295|nr:TRAP transporter small permease [Microbacterium sp. JZ31]
MTDTPEDQMQRGGVELPPKTEAIRDVLERRHPAYELMVNIERVISAVLLVGVFALVLTQVFTRYVLGTPLTWTEEAARLTLVWLAFLAAAFVSSRRAHITVDLLATILPRAAARAIGMFAQVLVILASAFLTFSGFSMMLVVAGIDLAATRLPTAVLYGAATVGFALILIHSLLALYMQVRYPAEEPDPSVKAAELEGL